MRSAAGFTLTELVIVIMLLGILAAVAVPRMTGLGDFRAAAFSDSVVATLRYAQKTATSHRRLVCVAFTAASVTLTIADANPAVACNQNLALANGAASLQSGDAANAVFTAADPTTLNFNFQPDGTGTDRSIVVTGQPAITVVGATGSVR